jgi:hypothetical protein
MAVVRPKLTIEEGSTGCKFHKRADNLFKPLRNFAMKVLQAHASSVINVVDSGHELRPVG